MNIHYGKKVSKLAHDKISETAERVGKSSDVESISVLAELPVVPKLGSLSEPMGAPPTPPPSTVFSTSSDVDQGYVF